MNQIDLNGQVAVITGGAQGIGFAIARRLIASGAKVNLWDMNAEQLEQFRQTEMTTLRGLYEDSLEEKLRECSQMVHAVEMQQPGLKHLLQSKGIGDAAVVLTQLIAHSQIWHARRKG